MSGKLEGIGARLRNDRDLVQIADIVPGGPAWKTKKVEVNDHITLESSTGTGTSSNDIKVFWKKDY